MMYYNPAEDPISKIKLKITSRACLEDTPPIVKEHPKNYAGYVNEIHRYLYRTKHKPNIEEVFYEKITYDYVNELITLHKEWFPVTYDRDYFKRFLYRKSHYNLGAFVKFGKRNFLVGVILGEERKEKDFNMYVPGILDNKGFCCDCCYDKEMCAYINNIGVIEEYRQFNIGSQLLEYFINEMKSRNCATIYLHCIDYNDIAMKFYEKNKFTKGDLVKNHYFIEEKYYGAVTYYMIINDKYSDFKDMEVHGSINEIESGYTSVKKGCMQSFNEKLCRIFNIFRRKKEDADELNVSRGDRGDGIQYTNV